MQVRKKSLSLRLKQTLFMKKIIIAIDGFSSCGKSTMAKDLAREIGYIYIDSGAMYRAVTLYCMEHGLFNADGSIREKDLQDQMDDIHISFRLDADSDRRRICTMSAWKTASAVWKFRLT